jgi:hypothetical protein
VPVFNEDVVVNGRIRVVATGDGAVLLELANERHWEVRQRGTDSGSALELANVGGGGNKNLIVATTGRLQLDGGTFHVRNRGDGKVLLHLDSERGWVFRQRGVDGQTALELTGADPGNNNKDLLINTDGQVGIGTLAPTHRLHVGGDVRVDGSVRVGVDVLLDGADCAEEFDVDPDAAPGSVLVVGQERRLQPCSRPYDTRVAGVVSGAGDLRPGIVLGRRHPDTAAKTGTRVATNAGTRKTEAPRRLPVALNGTVNCRVDATDAPIAAGDLLTTSARPGCAMRAADAGRAFGAVLGKALDGLASGTGTIPVLVTLH